MRRNLALAVAGGCLLALTASGAAAANVVENGSLEDLNDRFTDTRCGYMAVPPRSHAITKWTVPPATTGALAWGTRTCDGYTAAKGAFFLDLTGFGAESSNGAIQQTLRTESGTHYRFSIDVCTCNDGTLSVKVGPETLSLSPGRPFAVRGTSWTPMRGSFKVRSTEPTLKLKNATPGAQIVVIDHVVIEPR